MYLPGALQIGVDYGLFWRLTPKKLEPFLKAYESKQKEQLEFINIAGWVNGMYAGYSLGAAFGENVQYPEKPVQIFRSEEEIQENTDWEAEYFSAYAAMFNKQFEEKGGMLWSSIFVTLMANKIGGLQFGIYRNCQISSRVFHTAVAALPLTKANRSDFE